jgi:hypothetical protein
MFSIDSNFTSCPSPLIFPPGNDDVLDVSVTNYRHYGTGHCLVVTMYIPTATTCCHDDIKHMIWINSRNSYCFHGPVVKSILDAGYVLYIVDSPGHGVNQHLGPAQQTAHLSYDIEFRPGLDFVRDHVIGRDVPVRAIGDRVGGTLLLRYQQDHQVFESICLLSPLVDVRNVTCRQSLVNRLLNTCGGWQLEQPRWSRIWYETHGYNTIDHRYHPLHHSSLDLIWFREILVDCGMYHRASIHRPVHVILGDRESNVYISRTKQLFRQTCDDLYLNYTRSCERWGVIVHEDFLTDYLPKFLDRT